jgi:hypothetical protein
MMTKSQNGQDARRYRSVIPLTVWSVGAFVFLVLGIGMVVDGFHAGLGESVVGGLAVVFACIAVGYVFTSYAELTPAGLAYRFNFRRKMIPWASIESFRASRGPGTGVLLDLMVERRCDRPVLVRSIAGTRRYVERVIADIEAYRAQLGPAAVHGRDQQ